MTLVVRTLEDRDLPSAASLWGDTENLGPPPTADLERVRERTPELVLVAELDGDVIGVVLGGDDGRRGWISRLAVDRSVRRQGVASRLLRELEGRLASRGCRRINVLVFADNHAGRTLWETAGYEHSEGVVMYRRSLEGPDGGC